ncbi:MAG: DUF2760 domain-containing protein [Nitrospirae bacterium YQR-1]
MGNQITNKAGLLGITTLIITVCIISTLLLVAGLKIESTKIIVIVSAIAAVLTSVVVYAAVMFFLNTTISRGAEEVQQHPQQAALPACDAKVAQVLSVLQKKGRLIDFLQEDISDFTDSQIGQAVRSIHRGCKEALVEYLRVEPIMEQMEGHRVTVSSGFDPSTITLTGNAGTNPPFSGRVIHPGWRLAENKLPELLKGRDQFVIEPAEVEIL